MKSRQVLVLKFGGTSMGNSESIKKVISIVLRQSQGSSPVTVVSAMSRVTDELLSLGNDALHGRNSKVESRLKGMRARHEDTFSQLTESAIARRWMARFLEKQFREIREISQGINLLREFSDRVRDKLLSYGEVLSSQLLARVMSSIDSRFRHCDARKWITTEGTHQGPVADLEQSERLARRHLFPLLERKLLPVIPGFICRAPDGTVSTLGRNGSDYSASIVAAVLKAAEIWIYTDVDGILTADPGLVTEAAILPQISYQEAAEMSYFGAKVLHPKTMIPAVMHRIPIRIKNTFNSGVDGTLITDRTVRKPVVKTVTSVRDLAMLNIQGNGMVGIPGVASRLFEVLARENINVMMISQSSSEHSICIIIQAGDALRAEKVIRSEFQLELERRLIEEISLTRQVAIISIIGAGMRGSPGISGKFFEALGKCRINVLAIAQGSSEANISAAIWEKDYRHAVQAIHTSFGLTRDLNIFLFGCGNIGRTLLRQIHDSRKHLARSLQVNLRVLGVCNSRHWNFAAGGLTGASLKLLSSGTPLDQLPATAIRPSPAEIFRSIAKTYRSDVVLVDATAAELADAHIQGLSSGYHIVSANKKPLTSRLDDYRRIQRLRKRKGLNYLYEATFGAGLPLLSTLQDLINTGDEILRIQGCLSGTLGFICSRLDEQVPFSKAVREAMNLGFTEPDPRDDLSGMDVARKALIIARELGFSLELSTVGLEAMLPRRFFRIRSVEDFLGKLPAADKEMSVRIRKAHQRGMTLRYIADIGPKGCVVGMQEIPRNSPIGRLAGPDNILVFQTQRYCDNPLVIQGPGAGAGVTAAGVLGDILKIAKWI